ncbi:hypothetical protein [Caballeronia sp. NK8]|uniref:hypothetical protein n=1 Tax=Caballeronia sp. NK8 TaxID=140098 RepID=UPI001BD0B1EB|nr:hypothetical protein [Caballeronia sp. NK8]
MKMVSPLSGSSTIGRFVVIGALASLLGACGGGGGSSSSSSNPPPPPPSPPATQPAVSVYAGVVDATGSTDGAAASAQFDIPQGLASDAAGDIFVADTGNFTIRKISNGVVSTLAGTPGQAGSADGAGSGALFAGPWMMASDSAGNLYVTDQGANATAAVIRKDRFRFRCRISGRCCGTDRRYTRAMWTTT